MNRKLIAIPSGYEYREYKNWRGIPKPRRAHFARVLRARHERAMEAFKSEVAAGGYIGGKLRLLVLHDFTVLESEHQRVVKPLRGS